MPTTQTTTGVLSGPFGGQFGGPFGGRFSGPLAGLLVTATLAGCGVVPQRLTLRDTQANDAALHVSLRPTAWSRADGRPARGFEAGYQQFRAAGPADLASGETVSIRNQTITGPDTLQQKAKLAAWHFGYTDRLYLGPAFELDVSVGGLRLDVNYELRPQSGSVGPQTLSHDSTLAYGSVTPRVRFGPLLALEARIATAGNVDADHDRHDAALVLTPVPQVALRLGYAWQRTNVTLWSDPLFTNIDLRVRARGPMASLRIEF